MKIKELIEKCNECKFATCEQCEYNWTDIQDIKKDLEENYIKKEDLSMIEDDGNIFALIKEETELEDSWLKDKEIKAQRFEKMKKMKWNVLYFDFNRDKIDNYNILRESLVEDINKKNPKNLLELREVIDKWAKYNYWSKAEYEIAVGGLFSKNLKEFEKIDIYRQIKMNLDRITEYVNNKLQIVRK